MDIAGNVFNQNGLTRMATTTTITTTTTTLPLLYEYYYYYYDYCLYILRNKENCSTARSFVVTTTYGETNIKQREKNTYQKKN